jgi:hypothetical protein
MVMVFSLLGEAALAGAATTKESKKTETLIAVKRVAAWCMCSLVWMRCTDSFVQSCDGFVYSDYAAT